MTKPTMIVDEMAAAIGISRPKAEELVHSDGFPVVRIGSRIRMPVTELEKWLERQASKTG